MGAMWDPIDPGFRADPYPAYRALLEDAPLFESPYGLLVVSRYEDIMTVLRSPNTSNDFRKSPRFAPAVEDDGDVTPSFLFLDPPDHTRLRGLVSRAFTPRRVEQLRALLNRSPMRFLTRRPWPGGWRSSTIWRSRYRCS